MDRRMEIAEAATYMRPGMYAVRWNGKFYTSDETHTLVDKVIEDEERNHDDIG